MQRRQSREFALRLSSDFNVALARLAVGLESLNTPDAAASFAPIRFREKFGSPADSTPGEAIKQTKNCGNHYPKPQKCQGMRQPGSGTIWL